MSKLPKGKPLPRLLFSRDYAEALHAQAKDGAAPFSCIESQTMTNVVLLATLPRHRLACARHSRVYRGTAPVQIQTSAKLAAFSHEPPRTSTTHYRIAVTGKKAAGKYLVFGTGNIIRAGKHNHADAVAGTAHLIRVLKNEGILHNSVYPAAMSCPNTVITGKFNCKVDKSLLEADWRVNSSKRFPGRSVSISNSRIVPEIYASDSRFIMPGVASPSQLLHASLVVDDVATHAKVHK